MMLAAWRLGVLLAVVGSALCHDLHKDLHDLKVGIQSRFRRFVTFVRPRVLHLTPDHVKPQVNNFFNWLLGIKPEAAPRVRRETSQELLQSRRALPGERISAVDTQRMFARDLDIALGKFSLQITLGNMVGKSGTVMGTEGKAVWLPGMERVNGGTNFPPGERVQFQGESRIEFSVDVTYRYQLSTMVGVSRTGTAHTRVKNQQAVVQVELVRPNSMDDCYITSIKVDPFQVPDDLDIEIRAQSSGGLFSTGGKVSSRLFPQCRTDFQAFLPTALPDPAVKAMTDTFRQLLKDKICPSG